MSAEAVLTENNIRLPEAIGQAVFDHFMLSELSQLSLPDAGKEEDVLDVARTVLNHTDYQPHEVADYIPSIKIAMDYFRYVFDETYGRPTTGFLTVEALG